MPSTTKPSGRMHALALCEQQRDLLSLEVARSRTQIDRLTRSRATATRQLAALRFEIIRLRKRASSVGVDLSTVRDPKPDKPKNRRKLPRYPRAMSARRRAAIRRAAYRRQTLRQRALGREQARRERLEQRANERARKRSALTRVRRAYPATAGGQQVVNIYLPPELVLRVRYAGIERDQWLRALNESLEMDEEWPMDVLPIRGNSGVIAQVLMDHFAAMDDAARQQRDEWVNTEMEIDMGESAPLRAEA